MALPRHLATFIERCDWTYAKTMPEWPHEYIVRNRVDEKLFMELASHILDNGYEGNFYNMSLTYLDHDEWVYWTMGELNDEAMIINRCRPGNTYKARLKSGTLPPAGKMRADGQAPRPNAFTALCDMAGQEDWCWNIFCTTCGHMDFRYGLVQISGGAHPAGPAWVAREEVRSGRSLIGDLDSVTEQIRRSKALHRILSEASVIEIAKLSQFPAWLGYLGLGLFYTERFEATEPLLTQKWGAELRDMVDENSRARCVLVQKLNDVNDVLRWTDLETVERDMKLEFRGPSNQRF